MEIFVNPNINVEDQLATVVFELLNAETLTESTILFDKATSAEIEKQMFVTEILRLEHRALLKRKAFFCHLNTRWAACQRTRRFRAGI